MNNKIWLFLGWLSISSFSAISVAGQLTATNGVNILAINGKDIKNYGEDASKTINLPAGNYQIAVEYDNTVKRGSRNRRFSTKPYLLDIIVPESDVTISVPLMRTESHANAFFFNPTWTITELTSGKKTELVGVELIGGGIAAFSDIEEAIVSHKKSVNTQSTDSVILPQPLDQPLPQVAAETVAPISTSIVQVEQIETSNTQNSLSRLQYWYQLASNEERKAFRRWMIDQE